MEVQQIRELLFEEMHTGVRTVKNLLAKIPEELWDFRPSEGMRTLQELANHLVQIPHIDMAIMKELSQEEVQQLEHQLLAEKPEQMADVMEGGFLAFKDYYESLPAQDFFHAEFKPFYFEEGQPGLSPAKWLVEVTTHVFHHRGQLFTYMKQSKLDINMFDLY